MNKKNNFYIAGMVFCILFFCISISQVANHYADAHRAAQEFTRLAEAVVEQEKETKQEALEETEGQKDQSLPGKYQELFNQNKDIAGWISIDGTNINYPVMYTPDNPDFYLKHNFEKEYSVYGVPYIAEHCDPFEPSDNVIIYGHHMKNGTMFTELMGYTDKKFYENHRIIHFNTLTETADYEVIAVFKTTVYTNAGFKYYLFANAEAEEDFNAYINACKKHSLYDTGVMAEYGDKLLTLSTCEYSSADGRLVVVAKKLTE